MIRTTRAQANQILAGQKTTYCRTRPFPEKVQVGVSLPVQYETTDEAGTTWTTHCRVLVTGVERRRLEEITDDLAKADGLGSAEQFRQRWREQYGERPVWVLSFDLDRSHRPRLLHRDSSHGYTEDPRLALRGEPEAVDAQTLTKFTLEARKRDQNREDERRSRRTRVEQRLADLLADAQARGVDIRSELRVLEHRIKRKVKKEAA